MSGPTRCDGCGARNAAGAAWCSQCWQPIGAPAPTGPPLPPNSGPNSGPSAGPGAGPGAGSMTTPTPDPTEGLLPLPSEAVDGAATTARRRGSLRAGEGRFRDTVEGLEWRCDTCTGWNPIERVTCTVCGAAFGRGLVEDEEPRPTVAPGLLAGASLVLPGAGHALLGLWGQAFVRGSLALVWGAGGLSLLVRALASGQPVLPAVPLLVGWLALAVTSVNDALVEGGARGQVLLRGRVLLWLVMGVIGATVGAAFVGAFAAVGAGAG